MTDTLKWSEEQAESQSRAAADHLAEGRLVAVPTETVYGLAADATNGQAVAAIFAAKGRPRFNPLICHVDNREMADRLGIFNDEANNLVERFWPGPLTLIVPKRSGSGVHDLVTSGHQTIAIRNPVGPAARIVSALGAPIAAPSANRSGRLSATRAEHVADQLGSAVDLIIDAGPTEIGLESTIVAVSDGSARLLRAGGIAASEIESVLGRRLARPESGDPVEAPGMLMSHYAPRARIRLNAENFVADEAALLFGPPPETASEGPGPVLNLSLSGDLKEAAANLFACLAKLDGTGVAQIAVAPIPMTGLGEAINDRLQRAAAPRPSPEAEL